ncbi:unnamed protein product [Vicia faba]|uniref:Uncharacterized protein n=1 Tax=Vicia faba TaxID=3906 RepID=A0AAV0YQ34_VICFA|nr:unnamed protein product [Vicia faba]
MAYGLIPIYVHCFTSSFIYLFYKMKFTLNSWSSSLPVPPQIENLCPTFCYCCCCNFSPKTFLDFAILVFNLRVYDLEFGSVNNMTFLFSGLVEEGKMSHMLDFWCASIVSFSSQ